SLGHNDPGTLYTASGFLALANSDPSVTKSDIAAGFTADAADEVDGECINSTQNDEGVQVLSHAKPVYSNNDGKLNSFVGLPASSLKVWH
ncbi:hypothetical protein Tco_0550755, partial [Tanacetum coccineum]